MKTFEAVSHFSQMTGLIYFFAIFVVVLIYALWPRNQKKFDEASTVPLRED